MRSYARGTCRSSPHRGFFVGRVCRAEVAVRGLVSLCVDSCVLCKTAGTCCSITLHLQISLFTATVGHAQHCVAVYTLHHHYGGTRPSLQGLFGRPCTTFIAAVR